VEPPVPRSVGTVIHLGREPRTLSDLIALGLFNYGKKATLDLTRTRLLTIRSFCRTLEREGAMMSEEAGPGPAGPAASVGQVDA
jgi:hypothetical protein